MFSVIVDSVALKGNEFACFVNIKGSFKIHNMVHDFLKKWCTFFVVHTFTTKIFNKVHKNHAPDFQILSAQLDICHNSLVLYLF